VSLTLRNDAAQGKRIFNTSCSLLPEGGGEEKLILLELDDISKEKEMEAQLALSGRMSALGQMASGVAHELNQPLNAIATYIQLLQSRIAGGKLTPQDELNSIYDDLLHEVRRMSDIIDHLRVFHRSGRIPGGASPQDIGKVIASALKLPRNQIAHQGIELKEVIDDDIPQVCADRSRLEQLIINLVLNARDALQQSRSQENKQISIKCAAGEREGKQGLTISISDNGPGIPADNIEKIFDPFYTTKGPDKGTGLGLAICYQTVIDMQGKIDVKSELDSGTMFKIWLPAAETVK
jgi:C4-dicarboxylate-specific signal transduction histidine kinase